MTIPDGPLARDLAIQEAAAAICPANHRRNADPKQPPCGVCYATAESAINAYVAYLVRRSYYGTLPDAPAWLAATEPPIQAPTGEADSGTQDNGTEDNDEDDDGNHERKAQQ